MQCLNAIRAVARACKFNQRGVPSFFITLCLLLFINPIEVLAAAEQPRVKPAQAHLQQTLDVADAVHLLSRTGIGSRPHDVLQYTGLTRRKAITKLLSEISAVPFTDVPTWMNEPAPHYSVKGSMQINQQRAFNRQRNTELAELRQWWVSEMLQTPSPQTERLVLFWHNHFVSAYSAINRQSTSLARQNQLFRKHALGNFREFVKAVLRDPAMLEYLDNRSNRKQSPNENLGRELLELFTMGEGNYSEADVKNAARALTGFTVAPKHDMRFQFASNHHDFAEKTLFGQTGDFGADDLVDQIMQQPAVATFITEKFWREYVNSTSINDAAVAAVAGKFRRSDYSLAILMRSLLQREEFWSPANRLAVIKSPVDLVVGTLRTRGLGSDHAAEAVSAIAQQGQSLFEPPNVAGWPGGESWITPNLLLSRMTWLKNFANSAHRSEPVVQTQQESESAGSMQAGMAGKVDAAVDSRDSAPAVDTAESMGDNSPNMMVSAPAMQLRNAALPSRVIARLASDDFKGTPEVSIELSSKGEVVWVSDVVNLKPGRDTLQQGVSADYSDFMFRQYEFSTAVSVPAHDEVQLHFHNDLSDGVGDRNVYVKWVSVNGDRHYPSDGSQQSSCIPKNPFNAGYLYCSGYVSIPTQGSKAGQAALEAAGDRAIQFNGIHADQVFLDRAQPPTKPKNPSVAFSLVNVTLGDQHWHNLQVQLQILPDDSYQIVLQRYNCWPDCLQQWPACSNRSDRDPYFRAVRVRLEPDVLETAGLDAGAKSRGGHCRLTDLHADDANLVMSLWRSLPELGNAVNDDRKLTRKKLLVNFKPWRKHFENAFALAPEELASPTSTPRATEPLQYETQAIDRASAQLEDAELLPDWIDSVDRLFSENSFPDRQANSHANSHANSQLALFAPVKGQSGVNDASPLQKRAEFKAHLFSPLFQLK